MSRPFQFAAGSLALDFADTVAGRAGTPVELLVAPSDLDRWFREAGFTLSAAATRRDLDSARKLRGAVYDAICAVIDGAEIPEPAIEILNALAEKPDLRPQWVAGGIVRKARREVDAVFSGIAADAIGLLRVDTRHRLRRCPECRMLFRDNSRPGKRRWCSSASGCGNRAKVRRHRANRKKEKSNE